VQHLRKCAQLGRTKRLTLMKVAPGSRSIGTERVCPLLQHTRAPESCNSHTVSRSARETCTAGTRDASSGPEGTRYRHARPLCAPAALRARTMARMPGCVVPLMSSPLFSGCSLSICARVCCQQMHCFRGCTRANVESRRQSDRERNQLPSGAARSSEKSCAGRDNVSRLP
jgi:hypothetical protein